MKVYLGADHRGFELKNALLAWLHSNNYEAEDCGALELDPNDDYVDFAVAVARKVANEEGSRGIVICGSGAGADIAANKVKGILCSVGLNASQVKSARAHDDLNVLSLASDHTSQDSAIEMAKTFLETEFDALENHARRIEKIKQLES